MSNNLQDRYAPNGVCFGCGPKNRHGLKLKSASFGDAVIADWQPKPHHVAFGNFGSGGIISVLMDCHGNWAAAHALMKSGTCRPRQVLSRPNTPSSFSAPRRSTGNGGSAPGRRR